MDISFIWILFLLVTVLQPRLQQALLESRRGAAIRDLERKRGSRVITMIHRQEGMAFFGIPISRYIDIEDSEQVLRAIELTDPEVPVDIILHTPGGIALAAGQIAHALERHPGRVTAFVPHYAMSGGTLVALGADEIVMAPSAVLGPVDPQLGDQAASSIIAAVEAKTDVNRVDDATLIKADTSRKALRQMKELVVGLLADPMGAADAERIADQLTQGHWTHDHPILPDAAKAMGLPVSEDLPREVALIMRLYPQPKGRSRSVEYLPTPYEAPKRRGSST